MNLPLAVIIDNIGQLIAVICVIGGLLIALTLPIAAIYFHNCRQKLWHETARLALEKGQPLPALPDTPPSGKSPANDIRTGLILIAVGAGLIVFFYFSWLRYLGAIPGCIGLALLLYGVFSRRSGRNNPPTDRPPQP
jgi:hypothetical protein